MADGWVYEKSLLYDDECVDGFRWSNPSYGSEAVAISGPGGVPDIPDRIRKMYSLNVEIPDCFICFPKNTKPRIEHLGVNNRDVYVYVYVRPYDKWLKCRYDRFPHLNMARLLSDSTIVSYSHVMSEFILASEVFKLLKYDDAAYSDNELGYLLIMQESMMLCVNVIDARGKKRWIQHIWDSEWMLEQYVESNDIDSYVRNVGNGCLIFKYFNR